MGKPQNLKVSRKFMRIFFMMLFGCLFGLCFFGCTLRTPSMNKLDSLTFSANLKKDANSNYGKKAAYFNGRIYYLSAELGTQGIYSMDSDGKDIALEIPAEDIRAISAQPDGLYYSGFAAIHRNVNGPFRQFRLYLLGTGSDAPIDLLNSYTFTDDMKDENVWDFYMPDKNTCIIRFINVTDVIGNQGLSVVGFENEKVIPNQQYDLLENESSLAKTNSNNTLLTIVQLNQLLFMLENSPYDNSLFKERLFGIGSLSVYDTNLHSEVLKVDRFMSADTAYQTPDHERWFCRADGVQMIFASTRGLDLYNIIKKSATELVTIKPPEYVFQQIDCGECILVFTENMRNTYWSNYFATRYFHQNRALHENLYRFDPDTGKIARLLSVGRNNAFLYADANIAVTGGGTTISIYNISGDKAVLQRTIEVEHNIVDRANKADTAGGWLFLYRFNENTQRDELIEKVYIGS